MSEQVKRQFGCQDCYPVSDLGIVTNDLGLPIFLIVIAVSLVAGLKLGKRNWALPLMAMLAVGSIFAQLSDSNIRFQRYHASRTIDEYKDGPPASHPRPENFISDGKRLTAFYKKEILEIPHRIGVIFLEGWLVYSVIPFFVGLIGGAFMSRARVLRRTSVATDRT